MALTKDTIGTTELWTQWQERHSPTTIRLLPATEDNRQFDTGHVTPDDRYDYNADRHNWIEGAREYLDTTHQAEQEAFWITRHESGDDRYQARLASAGYTL